MKYAPKVSVAIIEGALDTGRIPVDNSIKLKCDVDANPNNNLTFQWYINDEMIADATYSELVNKNFTIPNVFPSSTMHEAVCPQLKFIAIFKGETFSIISILMRVYFSFAHFIFTGNS